MYTSHSFSSLLQATNASLTNTASSLLNGLKIRLGQSWYICGNLALNEGTHPRRPLNVSPEAPEYQVLFRAALLIAKNESNLPMVVTVGFPNSTYRIYKELAQEKLPGSYQITWDPGVYGDDNAQPADVLVAQLEILPEIVSCMIALRKGAYQVSGSFFVISLGFGTLETGLSTDDGVIENAMVSAPGIHYAVNAMSEEIQQTHDLTFKSVQQLNQAFREGHLYINRKRTDLGALRRKAIQCYYTEIVSPTLNMVITDRNLNKTNRVFLCGGGVNYSDLVDCIVQEFGDILDIRVADEPETLASKGYLLNSLRFVSDGSKKAVGIDMGNIETRVTTLKEK